MDVAIYFSLISPESFFSMTPKSSRDTTFPLIGHGQFWRFTIFLPIVMGKCKKFMTTFPKKSDKVWKIHGYFSENLLRVI